MGKLDLHSLIQDVFNPIPNEHCAILIDLPDDRLGDSERWRWRRECARKWTKLLKNTDESASLYAYQNVHRNNADLPIHAWRMDPEQGDILLNDLRSKDLIPFTEIFDEHAIFMALTELSATAPLKLAAKSHGFRAATMGGFREEMLSALSLDYREVNRRVESLQKRLTQANGAYFTFYHSPTDQRYSLFLDLRHREAHASGGLFLRKGIAGNLPSGEAYIVPYEGELDNEPSKTHGLLPVEFKEELVVYEISENRATKVIGEGEKAKSERAFLKSEPAYGNIAELGLGVLADFGVLPIGEILLDEKLGLHIAFGRSDHFGGQIGAKDFSTPDAVVHIDRVYIPQTMPDICVERVELEFEGDRFLLMENNKYAKDLF